MNTPDTMATVPLQARQPTGRVEADGKDCESRRLEDHQPVEADDKTRCGAETYAGAPCRRRATQVDRRCKLHFRQPPVPVGTGDHGPESFEDRQGRCQAITASGRRCRAWARLDYGLCHLHGGSWSRLTKGGYLEPLEDAEPPDEPPPREIEEAVITASTAPAHNGSRHRWPIVAAALAGVVLGAAVARLHVNGR